MVDKVSFALELYQAGRPIQREEEAEEEGGGEGPLESTRRRRNKREEEEGEGKEEGALYSRADVRMMLESMNMVRKGEKEGGREGRRGAGGCGGKGIRNESIMKVPP